MGKTIFESKQSLGEFLDEPALSAAAQALGRRGGLKGGRATGAAKVRGDSAHYRAIGAKGGRPKRHPYTYAPPGQTVSRLSNLYSRGRDGMPCPPYAAEPTSSAYKAWRTGADEHAALDGKAIPED